MEAGTVTIVFSVNEAYAKYLSVSIQSVISCCSLGRRYEIYVLYMDLEKDSIRILQQIGRENVRVVCRDVSEEWRRISSFFAMHNEGDNVPCAHVSKETYFHIFVSRLFRGCGFVICADCDVLFLKDPALLIDEVGERQGNAVIYGVKNFSSVGTKRYVEDRLKLPAGQYINAGIFVMNVQRAVEEKMADICESLIPKSSQYVMADQDMINTALSMIPDSVGLLDARWNFQWHPSGKSLLNLSRDIRDDYLKSYSDPYVIHYMTADKPWKKPYRPFAGLFWDIAKSSPYYHKMKSEIIDYGPAVLRNEPEHTKAHTAKVSVIVPVYNGEEFIVRCLDSIHSQSLSDIEIICVDDGSDDRTHDLLMEYRRTEERLTVVRQRNSGAGEARNTGIRCSSGEYLYFLDADDYIDSKTLELAADCADEARADIVIFDAFHIDENGEISCPKAYLFPQYADKKIFSPDEASGYLFMLTGACVWNKLYRAGFIRENGMLFQQLPGADDTFFSMLSLPFARRIALCRERLVYHTINRRNSQMAMIEQYPLNQTKAFLSVRQVLAEYGFFERYEQCFVSRAVQNMIKNLSRMNTYSVFQSVYNTYKESIIRKLGADDKEKDYFLRQELYFDIQFILHNECSEDIFCKRKDFLSISKRKAGP